MGKHSRDSGAGRVRQLAMRAEPVRKRHRNPRKAGEPGDAEHPDRCIAVVLELALVCGQKRRDAFDTLYRDGDPQGIDAPKRLSIGLHCRLARRPGRAAALARFLAHLQGHRDVWLCRRIDLVRHWHATHSSTQAPVTPSSDPAR
jgi:peptidoglycan/xylan/chitin deacetylase (PgdA/CDA1 family)